MVELSSPAEINTFQEIVGYSALQALFLSMICAGRQKKFLKICDKWEFYC